MVTINAQTLTDRELAYELASKVRGSMVQVLYQAVPNVAPVKTFEENLGKLPNFDSVDDMFEDMMERNWEVSFDEE